jgi:hypothetical protein
MDILTFSITLRPYKYVQMKWRGISEVSESFGEEITRSAARFKTTRNFGHAL